MFNGIPTLMKYPARTPYLCGPSGFSFDNCLRNKRLIENGLSEPNRINTGTTLVGIVFDGGVIIAAESRATNGNIIPSKKSRKVCELQTNIFAGGAGVARDTNALVELTRAQLELHRMNTGFRRVPVRCANQMMRQLLFRFNGNMQANVIIGGVDASGAHLFCTRFDGTTDPAPFTSLGSGNLSAMSILESRWSEDLSEKSACALACDAVAVGMKNDLNSGGMVSLCIVRRDFSVQWEEQFPLKDSPSRTNRLAIKPGCTTVLSTIVHQVVPWQGAPAGPKPGGGQGPVPGSGRASREEEARRRPQSVSPPGAKRWKGEGGGEGS
ncbi:proteasome subunit beta type-2 isoform X1 [Drosophila teissieri]|uniref:proteasome subunit beta type-2 isoform X1 n=2 Tax=Drosophila teissieri TaxID=7243 RepID=UPI001CBA13EC|nr:proteasome subunit beta type-2 isoform X1 [Drosophila teissieri]